MKTGSYHRNMLKRRRYPRTASPKKTDSQSGASLSIAIHIKAKKSGKDSWLASSNPLRNTLSPVMVQAPLRGIRDQHLSTPRVLDEAKIAQHL